MSKAIAAPHIEGQTVKEGDVLYMTSIGSFVDVTKVNGAEFSIYNPIQRGVQSFGSDPKLNRRSNAPLFKWEDTSKIPTYRNSNQLALYQEFHGLVQRIQESLEAAEGAE